MTTNYDDRTHWPSGEEIRVGDVFDHRGTAEFIVTGRDDKNRWRCRMGDTNCIVTVQAARFLRRADRAPLPVEPTPPAPPRPKLPVDKNGREMTVGTRFRYRDGDAVFEIRDGWKPFCDRFACVDTDGNRWTYGGKYYPAALWEVVSEPAEEPAPKVEPQPVAAGTAEAASLHERYSDFRATVERVVREEAPMARVVTDMARQLNDVAFIAWIDFGRGVSAVVKGGAAASGSGPAFDVKIAADKARRELGTRVLRGETEGGGQ